MLTYTPGDSPIHRLDPRSKLLFQAGFAVAAFLGAGWVRLAGLFALGGLCVVLAGLSVRRALWSYRVVLAVLALGPVIAAATLGPPWIRPERALSSLEAVARVPPILLVSAAYVHATPVRETRAAIQRTVPGRTGQLVGVGVGLTVRFLPVVRGDVREVRAAMTARGGDRRSVRDRAGRLVTRSLARTLRRREQLSLALRARCFAWNPTLPRLSFSPADYLVCAVAVGLAALTVVPIVVP